MVKLNFICLYCDNKWTDEFWAIPDQDSLKCPTCGDKHIKAYKEEKKIDYYSEEVDADEKSLYKK